MELRQSQELAQKQVLSMQMQQSLKLLGMDLDQLREKLYRELQENPVIDDMVETFDKYKTGEVEDYSEREEEAKKPDFPEDNSNPDYWEEDADRLEKRRKYFDSLTKDQTLEEHLRLQIGTSGLDAKDSEIATFLVGSLDDNGYFRGSIPDIMMAFGVSRSKVRHILKTIMLFDPPGCGATSPAECLNAQLDKLEPSPLNSDVKELIDKHLEDLARGDKAKIISEMGISDERYDDIVALLKTLEPYPGRAFAPRTAQEDYVKIEIHAVKKGGRWIAKVDERDIPDIHISKRYLNLLANPNTSEEAKIYIQTKIDSINAILLAIRKRHETIKTVAQAIFDAQSDYWEKGDIALKPLAMQTIADKTGLHRTTVLRTVHGKYVSTPFGVKELKDFFVKKTVNSNGENIDAQGIIDAINDLIAHEDSHEPLSDDAISKALKTEGLNVARRTVAKYRLKAGIPGAKERRK